MSEHRNTELPDRLHHVAIQVEDIARAARWYQETFHVDVTYQDETWAMLRFNNIDLALVVPGEHPPHIAIESKQADCFGQLTLHRDGTQSVYTTDSEGNVLEVMKAS